MQAHPKGDIHGLVVLRRADEASEVPGVIGEAVVGEEAERTEIERDDRWRRTREEAAGMQDDSVAP